MRVRLSTRAETDVFEITSYLKTEAGYITANRYSEKFLSVFEELERFPGAGSPRPKFGAAVRVVVEAPYLIFDELRKDEAFVLRILDGRRRLTCKLISSEET